MQFAKIRQTCVRFKALKIFVNIAYKLKLRKSLIYTVLAEILVIRHKTLNNRSIRASRKERLNVLLRITERNDCSIRTGMWGCQQRLFQSKTHELDDWVSSKGWSVSTKPTCRGKPHDRQNKERLMQPRTRHTEEQNRARKFGQSLYRPTTLGRTWLQT